MDLIAEQLLRARHKPNPATTALEKETERFKYLLKKNSEKNTLNEFTAAASFTLLELWNKYIKLVPKDVFNKQIISMGDLLFEKQEYAIAKNLCYQWYLLHCITVNRDGCNVKEKYFSDGFHSDGNINATVLTFKALMGDAVSSFYLIQCKDYKLMDPDHQLVIVKVLSQLRGVTQAGLYYEPLYWLVHNGIVHIYTIAQHLMTCNLSHMVVEYLLWAAVCMESSVPLMAVKFLSLRASIYTTICQCYYDINQPLQAELFARRGLDKVNELARMENMSSEETNDTSELTFRTAALKLGVMVFKRSVLESRTKNKSILRTKSKPTVKDSIQNCAWPRSPTEKLLSEMFNGRAAQFLAVLKALEDHGRRPLYQGPPNPKTELDQDTIFDVYHELFCAGTELALSALDASAKEQLEPGGENYLLQLAINGQDVLSVGAIEVFARLAYNYEQMEVFNMLLDPLDRCVQYNIAYCQISLSILTEVETLKQQIKATKDSSGKPQIVQLLPLARVLEQAIRKVNDFDLLLDASLLLWKHGSQYYQHIVSSDLSNLRHHEHDQNHTFTPPLNFVQLLVSTQSIFHRLELWKVDVVLYISVCLKLAFLLEGGAQGLQINDTASTVKYDRAKLLDSRTMIEAGLKAVNWARCNSSTPKEAMELGVIHCELLYTYYRLQVKLASTHLPPPPPPSTTKPSMLKSKVKERQLIEENRKKAMASVTAPDDIVPSWSELVEQCANDQCCHMLLLMAQSSITSDDSVKEKLVKEAEACLLAYQKQKRPQQSVVQKSSPSHSIPPAPELVRYSGTHMVFKPSSFLSDNGTEVCWYKLFGCHAVGSNIKVRLSDHHYPGLGNLVPATEPLVVTGLQPNEMYVFAVAAYSADGKLVGGSIGETSKPLVASHDMPVVVLWGLLAQCAYLCKVNSVALRAAQTLRKHFVADDQDSTLKVELLESYPTSVIRLYLNSIFIHASVSIEEGCLWCDQVAVAPSSLLSSQQARLQLCTQLLTALEVGQHLNSPSHCLQIVVMLYGLLMPLLQYGLTTKNIAWILTYCFSVLQEVPIQLLHSQSHLHHMVAVISYNLAQLMLTWKEKNIFINICEATKLLLLATLPMGSPAHPNSAEQGSIPSVNHPLYQQIKGSVVLSEGNTINTQGNQGGGAHNSLVTTLTTISSIMTSSVPTKKGGVRQRKGRRNNTLGHDTITDEMKSDEIRAIEAFVLSNQGSSHLDDTELTGQEDINLLHTIINILPLTAAHREVVKFHRRPHYLSLLVLLLRQAIAEGNYDLVLEWSREARHWLNRRNDLLLTHHLHQHQRPVSALNKTAKKALVTTKKSSKVDLNLQPNKIQTAQSKAVMETTTNKQVQQQHRRMHLAKIEITRDDLTVKARAVLKDRLTTLWKHMSRRRKLREVLSNEMCWRAQFNLCQAVSSFQLLLAKLDKPQQSPNGFDHLVSHTALRLDSTMVVIAGVIPAQTWIPPPLPTTTEETEGMNSQEEEPRVRPESARIEMKDTDSNLAVALGSSAALLYNRPPRPQSIKTDTPPLREKPKPPGLHWEMQECFTYYQRAIVLARRKKAWTLLQNASRALWNAINVFCDRLKYSNENDNTLPTLATMYATSLSSLYFAVDSLLDMVDELPVKLPVGHMTAAPLYYTADDDDASTIDGNFIARLGLLSVHVFYANQHWEKLLHCGGRLLYGMSQYTEQILPILLFAQRRLKDRISYYGPLIRNQTIHPAAHLDPGPTGHNIYGSVGYALFLTRFSTDPGQLLDRETMIPDAIPNYHRSVCHCRSLVARYLASAVPALAAQKMYAVISPDPDPPSRKITTAIELSPITADHFYIILEAYSNAIGCLEEQSELYGLKCELMSELGALLMHTGDTKLAAQWWERALTMLVGVGDHRLVSAAAVVESSGLWGCLLAGVLAARLAQYVYYNELDNHKIYVNISAALLKVLLSGNISMPHKDIDFALYNINGVNLLPGLEIFSNPFRCNAHSIADSFQYTCEQLVYSNEQLTEALPLLSTYEYFSYCILCNVHHYVMSVILKVELLTQLNMFSEALMLLWQILTGEHLPVTGISATTTHRGQSKFDNAKQMSDQRNFRVLATVLDRALPPSLQKLYGEGLVQRVILTQAGLLVKIASTNVTIPHQNILGRAGHCSRPGTTLSDYVPSASGHLASEVPSSAETTSSTTTRCSKGRPSLSHEEIKLLLLEHSEQLICQLCNKLTAKMEAELSCHHLWMLARSHLLLARVSRLYHQPLTAVKICHNVIVLLQRHLHQAKSIVPAWRASPRVGTHLWLLCQLELLDSLTHCHAMPKGWGSCMDILEEGLKGTTACGDDTLADKMKLKSILYFLKIGDYSSLKKYLPHSPLQGQCNLTDLQMSLIMCDEVSHDPSINYSQLEDLINKMLMERTPSSDVGLRQNAYQHELYLLQAHVGVQLSYEQLCQMEKQSISSASEDESKNIIKRLERVIEMCNLCGGQCITLKGTALFCLAVTWHKLYAEEVTTAEPLHEVASKYIECLLTIQPASIAHVGLVVNCYLALAELFTLKSKAAARISPVTVSQPPSRSGRSPEKDSKECYRDKIVAWNCMKAAAAIKQSYLSLSTITASLHKEDILKTLPDKAIVDLPDFVLLELCGSVGPHQDPLPVESIAPSRQSFSSMELTWLPILNYHCSLHQQFTPTRGLLPNGLPADVITTASQCSNLHHFLSDHLSYYSKSCVIPGIPKVLIPYAISQQSAPSMTGSYTPVGEWEVVILWNPPVFSPEQVLLNGVVSLHHKSSTQQQAAIKVFTIRVMSQELESLLSDWLHLGSQHEQTISESRQGEKTSLKSKKKLKQISSGSELEELISQQVNALLAMLSGKSITGIAGKIPTLLPQSVPTIAKLLQPLGQCTANGEDVYKLFYKLSELL